MSVHVQQEGGTWVLPSSAPAVTTCLSRERRLTRFICESEMVEQISLTLEVSGDTGLRGSQTTSSAERAR